MCHHRLARLAPGRQAQRRAGGRKAAPPNPRVHMLRAAGADREEDGRAVQREAREQHQKLKLARERCGALLRFWAAKK